MKKFLWVEQYRPQKIDDCILPDNIKKPFKGFVEKGEIPNLLLLAPLVLVRPPSPKRV